VGLEEQASNQVLRVGHLVGTELADVLMAARRAPRCYEFVADPLQLRRGERRRRELETIASPR